MSLTRINIIKKMLTPPWPSPLGEETKLPLLEEREGKRSVSFWVAQWLLPLGSSIKLITYEPY